MKCPIPNQPDCIIEDRGGIIENIHYVHAAIVDSATGRLLYSVGNAQRLTLIRSAAKPMQTLSVLEACGDDTRALLDEADIALISASHNSEPRHIERVRSLMDTLDVRESDLRCGGHPPLSMEANRALIKADVTPTAIYNNCSAKHTAMVAGARTFGGDGQGYHLPTHPMQIKVKQVVEQLSGLEGTSVVEWAIDGCNLATPALPLDAAAVMYARLAASADQVASQTADDSRTKDLARIYHAMSRHPEMVGGEGRFCTQLMRAFEGVLVGKVGADGCYGIAIRESEQTRKLGAAGSLGIMVKVEDGNVDVVYSAVMIILEQLDIGSPAQRQNLTSWRYPKRLNTMGVEVGSVRSLLQVRPC